MVLFHPLSDGDQLREVARLQLSAVAVRLAGKGISLDGVTDAALDVLLSRTTHKVTSYCCVSVDADAENKDLVFNVRMSEKKPVQPASDESNASSLNDADVTKSSSVKKTKKPGVKRSNKRLDKADRC
ncbi:hypothetical protein EJB05_06181, partial [Eragrostis curvula]